MMQDEEQKEIFDEEVRQNMNEIFEETYQFMDLPQCPGKQTAVRRQYLVDPMYLNVAINLNTFYTPGYKL